jgi:hypothetical protein
MPCTSWWSHRGSAPAFHGCGRAQLFGLASVWGVFPFPYLSHCPTPQPS